MNSTNEAGGITTNHFQLDGIPSANINLDTVGNSLSGTEIPECSAEQNYDYSSFSSTELRKKFPRTYKCWDNMKQRRKKGAIIHKEFSQFSDFLRHVGPCEETKYTLDRLDNFDPEYAPGKVEWRDKFAQNSNKGNNVYITHDDGRRFTIAQWAAKTNQKPTTLYKRKAAGWNDMEIITGVHESLSLSIIDNPWPYENREAYETRYKKAVVNGFGNSRLAYLADSLRHNLSTIEKRLYLLQLVIRDRLECDDWEGIEIAQELYQFSDKLDEFKEMSVGDLQVMSKGQEGEKNQCVYMLKQIQCQIDYEKMKEKHLALRHESISEVIFLKFFNEIHQRPEYSLNLPPQLAKL